MTPSMVREAGAGEEVLYLGQVRTKGSLASLAGTVQRLEIVASDQVADAGRIRSGAVQQSPDLAYRRDRESIDDLPVLRFGDHHGPAGVRIAATASAADGGFVCASRSTSV